MQSIRILQAAGESGAHVRPKIHTFCTLVFAVFVAYVIIPYSKTIYKRFFERIC